MNKPNLKSGELKQGDKAFVKYTADKELRNIGCYRSSYTGPVVVDKLRFKATTADKKEIYLREVVACGQRIIVPESSLTHASPPAKPCELSCPKCGTSDIARRHLTPSSRLDKSCIDKKRENEFILIDGWNSKVLQECIMHHCRCCHYEWETTPLH